MSRPFEEKCRQLDDLLGVGRSFDMVSRELCVGGRRAKLWVVNGYAKDLLLERALEKLQSVSPLADIPDLDALLRRYIREGVRTPVDPKTASGAQASGPSESTRTAGAPALLSFQY